MEFLTINLDLEYIKGNLTPIHKINPIITHLLCADDILIMAKANILNAERIRHTLHSLKCFTGLDVNESTVYFSKGAKQKQQIADILKVCIGSLPVLYLGIPLSDNILKARDFECLIDKINKKFNHWNSKLINISGPIELVKIVIYPMIQFWL